MTHEEIRDLIDRWQRALERRDKEAFASVYADEVELQSPLAGSVSGQEGVRKTFDAFFTAFPDASVVTETPIVDGHRAAVVASLSGTHAGDFMGLPARGKTFRFPVVFLLEFRDGQIVRDRRIYDFTGLLLQIGAIKAKPA